MLAIVQSKLTLLSFFAAVLLLVLATTPTLLGQGVTGNITGTVMDPSGAAVAGASVTATNTQTGVAASTVTNNVGAYDLRFLPVGQYRVIVEAAGFSKFEQPLFALEVDHTAKIDVTLSLGSAAEMVNVEMEIAPLLNTTDASLGIALTSKQIAAIPLNGLNFSSVTLFEPGAVNTDPSGLTGNNAIERSTYNNGINSVNGNRNQANNYTLDGIDLNEGQNNLIAYNPAPEAIEEIKVISANAKAEYGNVNGGDVLTVLKSGTNNYHGSVYAYLQNQTLNANSWSNNFNGLPINPYTQTIFGGSFGGPIRRNKLFFFADYEGVRKHTGGSSTASVLTAAMRNGDFSALLNPPSGQPVQLYDTQNNFTPYLNNQVPVVNPVAKFLFAHPELYPLPNATPTDGLLQNNYHGPSRQFVVNNQGDIKLDWEPRASDRISGFYSQSNAYDGNVQPLAITFPAQNLYPSKVFGLRWVHILSPSLVNEARMGFTRVRWDNGVPTDTTGAFGLKGNSVVGIPFGTQQYPGFAFQSVSGGGLNGTASGSNGITGLGNSANTQIIRDNTFSYADNLSWLHGKHVTSFGAQFIRYQQNYFNNGNFGPLGNFYYGGEFTGLANGTIGYAAADFVLDRVDQRSIGVPGGLVGNRQWRSAGYAQDDWKIFPTLTLNLGLRYEFDQPWYEVHNKTANVVPDNGGTVIYAGAIPAGAIPGSKVCSNRACYDPNYKQFMPRIGFAWQAEPRLVVRGGYGATSFFEGNAANQRLTSSPPFVLISNEFAVKPSLTMGGGTPFSVEDGFGGATGFGGNGFGAWPLHIQPAYIQEFSLTTEYAFTGKTSLTVGYVGERGQHLMDYRNGLQLTAPGAPSPYPNIANLSNQASALLITESAAMMNYNALQTTLKHHAGHGLEFVVNYTFAKTLTNSSGNYGTPNISGSDGAFQNAYDSRADIGPSGQDVRHNLTALGVYELPFGRGKQFGANANHWLDELIGSWSLSGSLVAYSGLPITINGPGTINTFSYGQPRANRYRPLKIVNQSVSNWWGTDPSATPCLGSDNGACAYGIAVDSLGNGMYGSAGINTERAPGYRQVDASFFKDFHITERQSLGFRADFFNAFNIASYANPDNNVTDTTFGQITNTRSQERHIQFSLHYRF